MVGFLFHLKGSSYSSSYVTVSANSLYFLALGSRNSLQVIYKFPCVVPDTRVLTQEQEEAPQSRALTMSHLPANITVLLFCVSFLRSRNK